MSPVSSSRRAGSRLTLRTRSADEVDDPFEGEGREPFTPWPVAALIAGVASALFGWILICGLVVIGWLSARTDALQGAIRTGTHFWLLANGAGLSLQGERWTLVPLGVTALLVLMISGMAGFAVRQALLQLSSQGGAPTRTEAGRCVRNVTVVVALAYLISVTVTATIVGTSNQGGRALIGSAVIGLVSSWWGASRAAGYRVVDGLPEWLRAVPSAVQAALLTMVVAGAAVFVATVVIRFDQINELASGLGLNVFSGLFVLLAQGIFLPNFILWSGSWALGAGFRVGVGSVVSPTSTDLGLQPWVPIFGALPDEGPGSMWSLLWLASGVVAGLLAAVQVMRRRPRARFDETALVGGLAGVLAGLVYTALAAASGGDLGNGRLAGMGPRLTELAVMSGSLMGISGLATGLIWGLIRRPGRGDDERGDTAVAAATGGGADAADDEDTAVVDGAPTHRENPAARDAQPDAAGEGVAGTAEAEPDDEETAVVGETATTTDEADLVGEADDEETAVVADREAADERAGTVGEESEKSLESEKSEESDEPTRDLAALADQEETVEVDRHTEGGKAAGEKSPRAEEDELTGPVLDAGSDTDGDPESGPDPETDTDHAAGANDEKTIVIDDDTDDDGGDGPTR